MTMKTVSFHFQEKDTVKVDGDTSIQMVVLASMIRGTSKYHQLGWMDGSSRNEWIEEWRITEWDE